MVLPRLRLCEYSSDAPRRRGVGRSEGGPEPLRVPGLTLLRSRLASPTTLRGRRASRPHRSYTASILAARATERGREPPSAIRRLFRYVGGPRRFSGALRRTKAFLSGFEIDNYDFFGAIDPTRVGADSLAGVERTRGSADPGSSNLIASDDLAQLRRPRFEGSALFDESRDDRFRLFTVRLFDAYFKNLLVISDTY
jgi:hypothetical protein